MHACDEGRGRILGLHNRGADGLGVAGMHVQHFRAGFERAVIGVRTHACRIIEMSKAVAVVRRHLQRARLRGLSRHLLTVLDWDNLYLIIARSKSQSIGAIVRAVAAEQGFVQQLIRAVLRTDIRVVVAVSA